MPPSPCSPLRISEVGRFCTGDYLEICAASLDAGSSASVTDHDNSDALDDVSSASSSGMFTSDTAVEVAINATALNALVLEPVGGVSAARGYVVVENVS